MRSEGFARWNAPEAMNSTWSVRTIPYLVDTVVPSTSGSRSRCTPWRETSAPCVSWRLAILSISSRKTMPFCSTLASALALISSSLSSLPASSSVSSFSASATVIFFSLRRLPDICWNMPWIWLVRSSMPGGAMISICGGASATSTSISRVVERAFAEHLAEFLPRAPSRSGFMSSKLTSRAGGSSTSSTRSSAASAARSRTLRDSVSRVCLIAASARSRMMVSTSRPT